MDIETAGEKEEIVNEGRLKSLFRGMVDIYSPFWKEERVLEFLRDYMTGMGLRPVRQAVDENRYNLLVLPEGGREAEFAFVGHVDTVDAYDFEDFGWAEKEGRIFGLGTADMKGGCAAMIEAMVAATERLGRVPPVALALVVGEEEEGDGAETLLEDHYFPWAIIGEPTDLRPCLGHFGYMELLLRTSGKRMHASLANRKENPIEVLLNGLIAVGRYLGEKRPEVVYNFRDLFSARAGFAVADRCEAWADIHLPPASPAGEIAMELEEVFIQCCPHASDVEKTFRISTNDAGYEFPPRGAVVEHLQNVFSRRSIPWTPDIFRSHSDANRMWAAGIKPILLGPGRLEMAHTPEESVSFEKVLQAARLYADLIVETDAHC
jgi:acetylornithine deacetylase